MKVNTNTKSVIDPTSLVDAIELTDADLTQVQGGRDRDWGDHDHDWDHHYWDHDHDWDHHYWNHDHDWHQDWHHQHDGDHHDWDDHALIKVSL
jgi:hypothetical protein